MTGPGMRKKHRWGGMIAAALLALSFSHAGAEIKTIEPGKLTIGMNGDMPMTQLKDGQLGGTDGELMVYDRQASSASSRRSCRWTGRR